MNKKVMLGLSSLVLCGIIGLKIHSDLNTNYLLPIVNINYKTERQKYIEFKEVVKIAKEEKRKLEEQKMKELELATRNEEQRISRGMDSNEFTKVQRVTFIVTYYSDIEGFIGGGATGYKGDKLKDGDIALPKNIPYLSKVIFDGDDTVYTKRDTGGMIKWQNGMCHVDVFKKGYTTQQLNKLGKKYVKGYIYYK